MKRDEGRKALKDIVIRRQEAFRRNPKAAVYQPKVTSRHIRNLYTETRAREHIIPADYAEAAGGENLSANPIELLLSAFAACIESAFYEFAEAEGLTITALSADVEGTLDLRGLFMVDESVRAGFQDLRYTLTVESPDDEKAIRALAEKVIAHCPVVDSLVRPTAVEGSIVVTSAPGS